MTDAQEQSSSLSDPYALGSTSKPTTRPASEVADLSTRPGAEKKPRLGSPLKSVASTPVPAPAADIERLENGNPELVVATNELAIAKPARTQKQSNKAAKKSRKQKGKEPEPGTSEDVVLREVRALLGKEAVEKAQEEGWEFETPFEFREEVEVVVSAMSSTGEALALVHPSSSSPSKTQAHPHPWVLIVPFCLPGETIHARVYRSARLHSFADLISVVKPNDELRDMERVRCRYFGSCAGCQYQMLSYGKQLELKQDVVVKAYQHYSDLPPTSIPTIESTIGSPLQYGYRTKITPHFDAPPKKLQKNVEGRPEGRPEWLNIGFNKIGKRTVLDIEECPIATPVINEEYTKMRKTIEQKIYTYKKGVSLLLRDSLEIAPPKETEVQQTSGSALTPQESTEASTISSLTSALEKHVCITDHKTTVRERVGDTVFDYTAGSFFQNNNSVLVPLTSYVRDAIFPPSSDPDLPVTMNTKKPTNLVDAYCGAGLFALTLAPYFTHVSGIELSTASIASATSNAAMNSLSHVATFLSGDAADIFAKVQGFERDETVVIIDPPRKGCDERFLKQLVGFGASKVVYVSCNVHTQARDVGWVVRTTAEEKERGERKGRYVLESLRGFDLFPQTAHVESVAVLRLEE